MVPSLFIAPSQHSGPIQSPFSEARVIWGALTPSCHAWKEEIITEISNPNNSSWDNLHPENHIDHGKWIYRRKYLSGRTNMSRSVKSHISYWCNDRTTRKKTFSVSRPNTERWNGSAFFYYCYCKQVQTKNSHLDIVGCATVFPANFHFFHLLSTLQGFGFHFPKIDLSFCWVSGFHILVVTVHVQFWA